MQILVAVDHERWGGHAFRPVANLLGADRWRRATVGAAMDLGCRLECPSDAVLARAWWSAVR